MRFFAFAFVLMSLSPWYAFSATKLECSAQITIIDGTPPTGTSGTMELLTIPISFGQGQGLAMLGNLDNAVLISYSENVFGGGVIKTPKVCVSRQDSAHLESCTIVYTTDESSFTEINLYLDSNRIDKKSIFVNCKIN